MQATFNEVFESEISGTYYKGQSLTGNLNGNITTFNNIGSQWSIDANYVTLSIGSIILRIPNARISLS